MGAALALAYPRRIYVLVASGVMFAALLELLQTLRPGRHASLSDFLIDAAAVCIGIALAGFVQRIPRASVNRWGLTLRNPPPVPPPPQKGGGNAVALAFDIRNAGLPHRSTSMAENLREALSSGSLPPCGGGIGRGVLLNR